MYKFLLVVVLVSLAACGKTEKVQGNLGVKEEATKLNTDSIKTNAQSDTTPKI